MLGDGYSSPVLEESVPAVFELQAVRFADRAAIITSDETFTYRELDALANTIAARLLSAGGSVRQPVATLFDLGAANIASFLGVLKTGAPAVPLDPHWSLSNLRYIAQHCGAAVILAAEEQTALARTVAQHWQQVISVPRRLMPSGALIPAVEIAPDDHAVILFTSGSTGRPKGVLDSHRNLLHEVVRLTRGLGLTAHDRQSVLRANCAGAVSDVCTALLNGAALLPYDVTSHGFSGIAHWLEEKRPTIWRSAPSLFRSVFGALAEGEVVTAPRVIFLCGEPATGSDLELYRSHSMDHCSLVNCFGATEAATVTLRFFNRHSQPVAGLLPVGQAVTDMEVLLEDARGQVVHDAGEGELLVRSRYLALGYLNDPERTALAFNSVPGSPGLRLYRTGDLGLRDAEGELTVIGRRRWQSVLGSQAVDLAEIEAALLTEPEIEEAAVVIRTEANADQLLVCISSRVEGSELVDVVTRALGPLVHGEPVKLLLASIPGLPKTSSGKLDRVSLRESAFAHSRLVTLVTRGVVQDAETGPLDRSPDELMIAEIWREVLGIQGAGRRDSFFDLGGQSVQAAQVISRLEVVSGVRLTFRQMFDDPTIAGLAALLAVRFEPAD